MILPVPQVSSLTLTFFTFANNAAQNAKPAKTTLKNVSMLPHVLQTSFITAQTAAVLPYVLIHFTLTPPQAHALHAIQAASCVLEEHSQHAHPAKLTAPQYQPLPNLTSKRSVKLNAL